MNATTIFDEELSSLLLPFLENYEWERVANKEGETKLAINRIVTLGYSFLAFPIYLPNADTDAVFTKIMQNKTGRSILETKGDSVRFALRTKATVYPENAIDTWTMIAVKYLSLP
eukprot:TRINITY_DN9472_c0_g1_i2.p1 TRINITY_DN9472_c0_g1~~TRINITY_DN9472_c0_g1_i2.p1  ORF type:complete len:115 (-),score=6.20 TRINITY_DN9472_c0_g1_i2:31-375(-)